ncbi:hypothetical protein CDD83_391 [Cordyceps sp. RAO-2017]|nr:hypothetical protein CDD83_391 [Cordyceps sp. RAO-2017]
MRYSAPSQFAFSLIPVAIPGHATDTRPRDWLLPAYVVPADMLHLLMSNFLSPQLFFSLENFLHRTLFPHGWQCPRWAWRRVAQPQMPVRASRSKHATSDDDRLGRLTCWHLSVLITAGVVGRWSGRKATLAVARLGRHGTTGHQPGSRRAMACSLAISCPDAS